MDSLRGAILKAAVLATVVLAATLSAGCGLTAGQRAILNRLDQRLSTFRYDSVKIRYLDEGRGAAVVLLHGYGASSYTWRRIIDPLARKRRGIALDLKGFGLSDKPQDGRYSLADQAEVVIRFLRANRLDRVVLVGNSMGGAVALLAYQRLGRGPTNPVKGLVLIDSTAYPETTPTFISLLRTPVLGWLGLKLAPSWLGSWGLLRRAYHDDEKITEETYDTYAALIAQPGSDYVLKTTADAIVPPNAAALSRRIKEIDVPTLLIWGEEDRIIPLSVGRRLARDIPGAKLVVIPDCGHVPQEERPRETLEIIERFLDEVMP